MQMVINLAPASLSNKKVNFYTCPRLTFLKKNAMENVYKSISEPLDFQIFWGGHAPQTPLVARALGARNLPRLVLKSGHGPDLTFSIDYVLMLSFRRKLMLVSLRLMTDLHTRILRHSH